MNSKTLSAQNGAYAFATDVATALSNKLANPTGASGSCNRKILKALEEYMKSPYFARPNFSFNWQLTYPDLEIGRTSGCEQACPASGPLAGLEAVSGNDAVCSRNSTTTSSNAPAPSSSSPTSSATTTTTSTCPCPSTLCGNNCVNLHFDPNNCGSCGHTVSFLFLDSLTAYISYPNKR